MEVIYRAFDGTEFRDAAACVAYEQNHKVHAWDRQGRECNSANEAVVVHLEDSQTTKGFLQMCINEDVTCEGIDDEDWGWFYWDDFNNKWRYIENEVVSAFKVALSND